MANISFRDFSFQLSCFVFVFVFCVDSVFNSFSFLLSWIFVFSHFFRMSKLPESDWERQKGNLQQQNTVCDNGPKGWYRFEGAVGTRMPTSCSPTHRCNSHLPGWLSGAHPTQADGQVTRTVFFPLAFRLLLQINYRQSDKLRRLLCLPRKWHTLVSPPLLE